MNHIQIKYAFVLFCSILGEIDREHIFLVKKGAISERSTEILREFVFLNMFDKGQIMNKNWICLNNCFD